MANENRIYGEPEFAKYTVKVHNPFSNVEEAFEFYRCSVCNGYFLVESEFADEAKSMNCPYCQSEFKVGE